jgi:hypothetical protein
MSRAAGKTGKNDMARHCLGCGTVFWVTASRVVHGKGIFCSKECRGKFQTMGSVSVCGQCGKRFRVKASAYKQGRGTFCSHACQYEFGITDDARKKISKTLTGVKTGPHSAEWNEKIGKSNIGLKAGDKHPNWKGGVTQDGRKERNQSRYSKWRKDVLGVGKCECANCGGAESLDTHHIHDFLRFPELRYEVGNGMVLCEPCHYGLHFPLLASGA